MRLSWAAGSPLALLLEQALTTTIVGAEAAVGAAAVAEMLSEESKQLEEEEGGMSGEWMRAGVMTDKVVPFGVLVGLVITLQTHFIAGAAALTATSLEHCHKHNPLPGQRMWTLLSVRRKDSAMSPWVRAVGVRTAGARAMVPVVVVPVAAVAQAEEEMMTATVDTLVGQVFQRTLSSCT